MGKNGVIGKQFNSLKIWRKYTKKVYGAGIKSGHFIPEQNPKETIKHLKNFFKKICLKLFLEKKKLRTNYL